MLLAHCLLFLYACLIYYYVINILKVHVTSTFFNNRKIKKHTFNFQTNHSDVS